MKKFLALALILLPAAKSFAIIPPTEEFRKDLCNQVTESLPGAFESGTCSIEDWTDVSYRLVLDYNSLGTDTSSYSQSCGSRSSRGGFGGIGGTSTCTRSYNSTDVSAKVSGVVSCTIGAPDYQWHCSTEGIRVTGGFTKTNYTCSYPDVVHVSDPCKGRYIPGFPSSKNVDYVIQGDIADTVSRITSINYGQ